MLRITASSRFHTAYPGGRFSPAEMARRLKKLGFQGFDFCFNEYVDIMPADSRERIISELREQAERLDLSVDMCHLPFYNKKDARANDPELYYGLVKAGIDGAALLGVKNGVIHAKHIHTTVDKADKEAMFKETVEFMTPVAEYAAKKGVRLAFENLSNYKRAEGAYRFCTEIEDVCRVADYFSSGVCFDFGHANSMGLDQGNALRMIGSRLTAIHVNDNNGKSDEHLLPFFGNIDWSDAMQGLRDTGYSGNFNFEVRSLKVPAELRDELGTYVVALGRRLQML